VKTTVVLQGGNDRGKPRRYIRGRK
jgi:hypothetical protein